MADIFPSKGQDMYRFYCPDADFTRTNVMIRDPHEIHHIKNVLRLKKGSLIQLFNSTSQQADTIIEDVQDSSIEVRVQNIKQLSTGLPFVVLACAPPKKGKFEIIIEKCSELGVDEIIPLRTKRTEVVFSAKGGSASGGKEDKALRKQKRFESVAVNAAKQAKRPKVPHICPMTSLSKVLQDLDPNGVHIIPSLHDHSKHIADVLLKVDKKSPITIFIGPEGDFTPDEVDLAVKHGCVAVSLGDTVLKVETAAIASVALVKFLCRY